MTPVLEQSLTALEEANRVRLARAERKRQVYALSFGEGKDEVARIILEGDPLWDRVPVEYVLKMPKRAGNMFVDRVCREAQVSRDKRLGSFTVRQRVALANVVSGSVTHEWVRENF